MRLCATCAAVLMMACSTSTTADGGKDAGPNDLDLIADSDADSDTDSDADADTAPTVTGSDSGG